MIRLSNVTHDKEGSSGTLISCQICPRCVSHCRLGCTRCRRYGIWSKAAEAGKIQRNGSRRGCIAILITEVDRCCRGFTSLDRGTTISHDRRSRWISIIWIDGVDYARPTQNTHDRRTGEISSKVCSGCIGHRCHCGPCHRHTRCNRIGHHGAKAYQRQIQISSGRRIPKLVTEVDRCRRRRADDEAGRAIGNNHRLRTRSITRIDSEGHTTATTNNTDSRRTGGLSSKISTRNVTRRDGLGRGSRRRHAGHWQNGSEACQADINRTTCRCQIAIRITEGNHQRLTVTNLN